jgi:hypothetical protein
MANNLGNQGLQDGNSENGVDIEPLIAMITSNDLDGIKVFLNKYTPEERAEIINEDLEENYGTLFNIAVFEENIDIVSYFIENGANVNYIYRKKLRREEVDEEDEEEDDDFVLVDSTPLIDAIVQNNFILVKLLVEHGASLTTPPSLQTTILHHVSNVEILEGLLERGADINAVDITGKTALHSQIDMNEVPSDYVNVVLEAGANPNIADINGMTALDSLVQKTYEYDYVSAEYAQEDIYKIKLLRRYGANITPKIRAMVINANLYNDSLNLHSSIEEALDINSVPWKGWTRADAAKLDDVFGKPADFSACPVCLRYVERQDGCMYMNHKCTELKGMYNKKLYNLYKTPEGSIYWCTICNRICLGHRHYTLSSHEVKATLGGGGDPFAKDCRPYGGGYPEKVQRFNQLREHALELTTAGGISQSKAFNELTEEMWNAPLRREKTKIEKFIGKKTFGNVVNFPPNSANANSTVNANANVAIPVPASLVLPTLIESGYNSLGLNDDVRVLHFHHETTGGIDHNDSFIGVATLVEQVKDRVKNFGTAEFGFCLAYPTCRAKLYPIEIQPYVPEELYTKYLKKFNSRFTEGGSNASVSFFGEATNAVCLVKGGRRKTLRRRKKYSKKSRKHHAKN